MNKYSLFALAVIFIIVTISFFDMDPSDDEEEIIGFADDISSSENGYVFYISDDHGSRIKAFYSEELDDSLFIFSGSFSDDNSIFFVKNIRNY